jgi:DMSO/TMAO reductase YedYZ molybdopterin-dependent catalytic subunit
VPDLIVLSAEPLNAETPLELHEGIITPNERFYVRNHNAIPSPPPTLVVDGAVEAPLSLTMAQLRELSPRSLVATLECAGNGRAFLDPPVEGEQWRLGAVSTARWTGVPLRAVLDLAGVDRDAPEVLCAGADAGSPKEAGRPLAFERSLPMAKALHADTLLAYEMNDVPVPTTHGGPLRLVVPGWYGMASVKWLARISALRGPFGGFYQRDRYVVDGAPLREIEPRAIVIAPADGATVSRGTAVRIRGFAWSGRAPIEAVEVATDGGGSWQAAMLDVSDSIAAWRPWELSWTPERSGTVAIIPRARDARGAQPLAPRRNPLGYANNAARPVRVIVR